MRWITPISFESEVASEKCSLPYERRLACIARTAVHSANRAKVVRPMFIPIFFELGGGSPNPWLLSDHHAHAYGCAR